MKTLLALFAGLFLFSAGARAITVVPRTFDELVGRADTVFKGSVAAVTPQWVGEGNARHIVTFVTFQVDETYKGEVVSSQTLRFLGGTLDGVTMEVPDMPRFTVGQSAMLFMTGNGKQYCPLVGVHQGRFHVTKDSVGLERVATNDGSPVVNTAELGQFDADGTPRLHRYIGTGTPGMTAGDFRTEILGKVAVQPGQQKRGDQ